MDDVPMSCPSTLSGWVPMAGPYPAPQALQAITYHDNSQAMEGVWEQAHLARMGGG